LESGQLVVVAAVVVVGVLPRWCRAAATKEREEDERPPSDTRQPAAMQGVVRKVLAAVQTVTVAMVVVVAVAVGAAGTGPNGTGSVVAPAAESKWNER
jgi:uncharacterized MAPEG superfamily protein